MREIIKRKLVQSGNLSEVAEECFHSHLRWVAVCKWWGVGGKVDVGWDGSPSQYCKPSAWTNIISGLSGWKSSSSAVSYCLNYLQRGLKARALAASLLLMLSVVPQENVVAARRLVQRCRQSRYCKTFMSCVAVHFDEIGTVDSGVSAFIDVQLVRLVRQMFFVTFNMK